MPTVAMMLMLPMMTVEKATATKKMIATVTYHCQNDHHGEESEDQDYDNRAMDRVQELAHRAKPAR